MKSNPIYEIPDSLKALFENGETSYRIIDYSPGGDLDNIQALNLFIERVEIPSENILVHDGTQCILSHPDFDYLAVVDSGGLGDFFSHGFDISFVKEENGSYIDYSPNK